ncbi:helix-turn-helix domain-containing protein [Rhizobium anhuiense]|uniref:helix-turn-helix domain-containing protein n=1 Tax=Rhizobium anhuiense TaxID=1184720 RepID=UPI00040ED899|nr:helix-turn-helix domain-containing protein [Rhizobium anhuiense]PDS34915.1 AraC family transcriptional regulator [Rhizobium anhuiense]PDS65464.1 AraC family transcriptional regulator [Rhizobium anhuiense]UTS91868.1 helix-turn-helix domain-containing protein [Rhizobium anhuiense bv. trifolii]
MIHNSALTSRWTGADFDGMLETFLGSAPFDASPVHTLLGFNWSADARSHGAMTVVDLACNGEWNLWATSDTPEWLTIHVPRDGISGMTRRQTTTTASPGQMLLGQSREADRFLVRGTLHRSQKLFLHWGQICQAFGELFEAPLVGSLDLSPLVDGSSASAHLIKNLVETIMDGMLGDAILLHSPIAMVNLNQALTHLLIRLIPHRYSQRLERSPFMPAPRHVRRAIDFMQANIAKPITISMIAQSANVSVRTLENGFRTFKEATPASYLRTLRLRAARLDLLDRSNQQSIRDICLKWGFLHAGRFSALYGSVYGESPRETLRRKSEVVSSRSAAADIRRGRL